MATPRITRRRQPSNLPFLPSPVFNTGGMMNLADTFDELSARADEMFRSAFPAFNEQSWERFPAMNVAEKSDEFVVTAELPGMTAEDIKVEFTDGVLTIRGEKTREESKEEDGQKYYLWERRFGSFQRAMPLPGGIDEDRISAEFKNGVLKVRLSKADEAKTRQRTVPITSV